MTHPAIEYAEQTLGVHSTYKELTALQKQLDEEVITALDKAQDERRVLVEKIADREAALYSEERGKHATQSATWLDGHIKVVRREDNELSSLRVDHNLAVSAVQGHEYDRDMLQVRIKIGIARLNELGGYLQYLAAVKLAAIEAEKTTQPQEN